MVRLFTGFPLAEAVRRELMEQQARLRSRREAVKWVSEQCLHLTAVFLGELAHDRIPALCETLEQVAGRHEALVFRLAEPGFFGQPGRPRELWTGLTGPLESLSRLVEQLERGFRLQGLVLDRRRYRPHITIGRVRDGGEALLVAHLANGCLPLPVRLDHLVLYESRLAPEGPHYTELAGFPLAGTT